MSAQIEIAARDGTRAEMFWGVLVEQVQPPTHLQVRELCASRFLPYLLETNILEASKQAGGTDILYIPADAHHH